MNNDIENDSPINCDYEFDGEYATRIVHLEYFDIKWIVVMPPAKELIRRYLKFIPKRNNPGPVWKIPRLEMYADGDIGLSFAHLDRYLMCAEDIPVLIQELEIIEKMLSYVEAHRREICDTEELYERWTKAQSANS
ncbi:MAG: hypothetical protein ACI4CS_07755 [Candidatus Weimeria sp.]